MDQNNNMGATPQVPAPEPQQPMNNGSSQAWSDASANVPVMPSVGGSPQLGNVPVGNGAMGAQNKASKKAMKSSLIETIVLVVVCLIAAAGVICAVVFFLQWREAETNVQGQIDISVAEAVEAQKSLDEANFAEREKLPNTEFVGPSDYGSLSFMYPKTWSVYVAKDASNGGDYEAYFNPVQVEPVSDETINALRVMIYDRPIDQVKTQYESLVKNGKLSSSVYQVGDITGTLYSGQITNYVTGILLMIKINDKTAIIQTDSMNFKSDFESLIATIRIS